MELRHANSAGLSEDPPTTQSSTRTKPNGGNLQGGKEMRKSLILVGFILLAASSVKAQENRGFEISANYQYVRFNPGGGASGINCQGGSGSGAGYLSASIGIVGEFGDCKVPGLPSVVTAHEMDYLFCPRVYFHAHGRVYPFVQALFLRGR